MMVFWYSGIAIVIRITMMATTTMSSTNVKPRSFRLRTPWQANAPAPPLPFRIRCTIGCFIRCLAVYLENVLAAPRGGLGIVGIAAHAPLGLAGEGIDRDAAQEADLLTIGACQFLAFYQDVEGLRV